MSARKPSTTKDPVPSSPDDAVIKLTSDGSVRSESASRDTQDLLTADTPQIATNDAHEQIVSRNEQDNDHSASNEQTPQDVPTRDMVQLTIGDDHGGASRKSTLPQALGMRKENVNAANITALKSRTPKTFRSLCTKRQLQAL